MRKRKDNIKLIIPFEDNLGSSKKNLIISTENTGEKERACWLHMHIGDGSRGYSGRLTLEQAYELADELIQKAESKQK